MGGFVHNLGMFNFGHRVSFLWKRRSLILRLKIASKLSSPGPTKQTKQMTKSCDMGVGQHRRNQETGNGNPKSRNPRPKHRNGESEDFTLEIPLATCIKKHPILYISVAMKVRMARMVGAECDIVEMMKGRSCDID